jgi:hypothetical protein
MPSSAAICTASPPKRNSGMTAATWTLMAAVTVVMVLGAAGAMTAVGTSATVLPGAVSTQ